MIQPRYVIEVTRETRDFINELAAELTRQGPGTFGQKQAADYLVRCHKDAIGRLDVALAAELADPRRADSGPCYGRECDHVSHGPPDGNHEPTDRAYSE